MSNVESKNNNAINTNSDALTKKQTMIPTVQNTNTKDKNKGNKEDC